MRSLDLFEGRRMRGLGRWKVSGTGMMDFNYQLVHGMEKDRPDRAQRALVYTDFFGIGLSIRQFNTKKNHLVLGGNAETV